MAPGARGSCRLMADAQLCRSFAARTGGLIAVTMLLFVAGYGASNEVRA